MKIGVIGTGEVGRSVAGLLLSAGHAVRFGSRGGGGGKGDLPAPSGTAVEAAGFGEVVLCAAPYGAWPEPARDLAPHVAGKVVIDAANPYPGRDGAFAQAAIDAGEGAGVPVARLLPGAKLVRAFNCVPWPAMVAEADRPPGERIAIPLAGGGARGRGGAGARRGLRPGGRGPARAGPRLRPGRSGLQPPDGRRDDAPGSGLGGGRGVRRSAGPVRNPPERCPEPLPVAAGLALRRPFGGAAASGTGRGRRRAPGGGGLLPGAVRRAGARTRSVPRSGARVRGGWRPRPRPDPFGERA